MLITTVPLKAEEKKVMAHDMKSYKLNSILTKFCFQALSSCILDIRHLHTESIESPCSGPWPESVIVWPGHSSAEKWMELDIPNSSNLSLVFSKFDFILF